MNRKLRKITLLKCFSAPARINFRTLILLGFCFLFVISLALIISGTFFKQVDALPFDDKVTYDVTNAKSITKGDFNNDGHVDVAVGSYNQFGGSRQVTIFLSDANGVFTKGQELSSNSPYSLISTDLNNDTFLDLIVANYIPSNLVPNYLLYRGVTVFIGNGNGTFQTGVDYSTGGKSYDLVAADLDNNGNVDLVVSLIESSQIAVFNGLGDGTIVLDTKYTVGSTPKGMLIADLNKDNNDDVAVATSTGYSVIFGNGDRSFQDLLQKETNTSNNGITFGDFNNDTNIDLATVGTDLEVHIGDGTGDFFNGYKEDAIASHLIASDINNDGITDLIASKNNALVFIGNNDGTFIPSGVFQISGSVFWYANSIVVEDFDHDGRLDLAAGANSNLAVLFNLDRPYITFISPVAAFVAAPEITMEITGSDFDSNAVARINGIDLITTYSNSHQLEATVPVSYMNEVDTHNITVYNPNQSQESSAQFFYVEPGFFDSVNKIVGNSPISSFSADFNTDSINDLAIINQADNNVQISLGQGDGIFTDPVITTYAVGSNPSSITGGDYNNDTFIDLAITNSSDNTVSILLGDGTGVFANGANVAVGLQPINIITADFNTDNNIDLAVANMSANTVSILLGTGDGAFALVTTLTTNNSPVNVESADFNNDTFVDLISVNRDSDSVSIYLGNNDGSFDSPVNVLVGTMPYSAAAGDYNNDNFNDIAVANSLDDNIEILLGDGAGGFSSFDTFDVGVLPRSIVSNDFNQDGYIDLAVVNSGSNDVYVLLGSGNSSFNSIVVYSVGTEPLDILLSDLNNDDYDDLITVNGSSNNFSVLLKKIIIEIELFQDKVDYAVGEWPTDIVSADFDGDNLRDLAVVNAGVDTITILKNNGSGVFTSVADVPTSDAPNSLTVGDFNGDSRDDLAAVTSNGDNFSIFLGKEDGTLPNPFSYSLNSWPVNFSEADFNNDNIIDLAIANNTNLTVVFGVGNGDYSNPTDYATGSWPRGIASGDFNNDNQIDIAVVNYGSDNASIFLNDGTGTFSSAVNYTTGSDSYALIAEDLNNDNNIDLLVGRNFAQPFECIMWECGTPFEDPMCSTIDCDVTGDGVYVLLGIGDGTFASSVTYANLADGKFISAVDLDGDNYSDVIGGLKATNQFFTMFNNGNGTFAAPVIYNIDSFSEAIVACDLNNNNVADVLVSNTSSGQIDVFSNNGNGVLSLETEIDLIISPSSLICEDFNLDNKNDLAAGSSYSTTMLPVLFGNGDYTFDSVLYYYSSTGPVTALTSFDDNNDSFPDLVAVDNSHKKIATLINNGDGTFDAPIIFPGGGRHILNADFNNDTILDLVVGARLNLGNGDGTFSRQLTDIPGIEINASVSGDFNSDGNYDIAGVNLGNDRIAVSLGVGDGSFTGPYYYPVGTNPEDILTADFNNDSVLDLVVGNRTGASVSVLLGVGDGSFNSAITSNIYYSLKSIINGDFNGDGQQDLAVLNDPNYLSILLGLNNGTFQQPINYDVGNNPQVVITDDFNNDNKPDLALTNQGDNDISVFLGLRSPAIAYAPGFPNRPPSTSTVECIPTGSQSISWYFEDISNNEFGYKLYSYDDGLIKVEEGENLEFIIEEDLSANTFYPQRYVRSYNDSGESKASATDSCYTFANEPLSLIINQEIDNSLLYNVTIDSDDNNPAYTEYAIYELYSNQFFQVDGTLGAEINWLPYYTEDGEFNDWGGESGFITLLSENYKLIPYARNSDYIVTGSLPTEVYFNCGAYSSSEIKWTMRDMTMQNEFNYRLYESDESDILIVEIKGVPGELTNHIESELLANTSYTRYFNVYDVDLEKSLENSSSLSCFTLPNKPLPVIIGEITDETVQVIINEDDGNPEWTKYSLYEKVRGQYVQLITDEDGQIIAVLSAEPMWLTYQEWGGLEGVVIYIEEAQSTTKNYFVNTVFAQGLDFNFIADVQNEDGIVLSEFEQEVEEIIDMPQLSVGKFVALANQESAFNGFGNRALASNVNIGNNGLYAIILEASFIINLLILILLVLLILSLYESAKHLVGKDSNLLNKIVLSMKMLIHHLVKTFTAHAQIGRNDMYRVSYCKYKEHNQKNKKIFAQTLLVAFTKIIIILILISGIFNLNHIIAQESEFTTGGHQVEAGDQLIYKIEFANTGNVSIFEINLIDELSESLQYVDQTAHLYINQEEVLDSMMVDGNVLSADLIELLPGDEGNFEFTVTVLPSSVDLDIENQAIISGSNIRDVITNLTVNHLIAADISLDTEIEITEDTTMVDVNTEQPSVPAAGASVQNIIPVLIADLVQTYKNTSVLIEVLSNDVDPDGELLIETFEINQSPLNGSTEIAGAKIIYSPNQDYLGSDSFSYKICDNNNSCGAGLVEVLVIEDPNFIIEEIEEEISLSLLFFNSLTTDITETDIGQGVIKKIKENNTVKKIIENPVVSFVSEKVLNNPVVEQSSQNIVTPALVTLAIVNTVPAAIPVSINIWSYLHFLFFEPFMFLFRRKRKKWGIVYDSLTKMPISLAVIRLYHKETRNLIQTKVTDNNGRYLMILKDPGHYYLTVVKAGFAYPTELLKDDQRDDKYLDIYHGEELEVTESGIILTTNIPLDKADQKYLPAKDVLKNFLKKHLRLMISYVGFILSIFVFIIHPSVITGVAIVLHILLYTLFRKIIVPRKTKNWGIVYDVKTKKPLKQVIIRILDTRFNKLLETQITDRKGRYSFLVGKNEYQLVTEKSGYERKLIKPVDLVNNEQIVNLDIGLNKG